MPTARKLRTAVLASLAGGLISLTAAGPASAEDSVVSSATGAGAKEAREYWTPRRMRQAEPADAPIGGAPGSAGPGGPGGPASVVGSAGPGPIEVEDLVPGEVGTGPTPQTHAAVNRSQIADPAQAPFRANGKVFFTIEGGTAPGDYLCSGTALNSHNRSVVWTAGHCVFDDPQTGGGGGFATNWIFVPAYHDGATPFGEWPATKLATTEQWKRGNFRQDLGAAIVADNGGGQSLGEVVGGKGIGFNQQRDQTYHAFGYPAQQPPLEFNGERLFRCISGFGGTDNPPGPGPPTSLIACDLNGGSSGGGWLVGDTLLGVSSYKYLFEDDHLYGPYLGDEAQALYSSVAGQPEMCAGREVTLLGTEGPDALVGTSGPDVIKALGGGDKIKAKGGADRVCAGDGPDTVRGNAGRDKLKGQGGPDGLRGGKGRRDKCNGGSGRDTARSCEKVKSAS